ncbi:hypothetical protein H671_2g8293 [Cricetulus griseus]|nr:hypothetical protein H671_2g8293 [Cricetulus griseus]
MAAVFSTDFVGPGLSAFSSLDAVERSDMEGVEATWTVSPGSSPLREEGATSPSVSLLSLLSHHFIVTISTVTTIITINTIIIPIIVIFIITTIIIAVIVTLNTTIITAILTITTTATISSSSSADFVNAVVIPFTIMIMTKIITTTIIIIIIIIVIVNAIRITVTATVVNIGPHGRHFVYRHLHMLMEGLPCGISRVVTAAILASFLVPENPLSNFMPYTGLLPDRKAMSLEGSRRHQVSLGPELDKYDLNMIFLWKF